MISKQDFDDSSGDGKDEERESLRKLYNEVFMVCSFHQMILRLSIQEE
jgi:regulator of replication initiation timing